MSKKRETIVEITKKLRCMDFNSVAVMKTAADILAAKERLDRESAEERKRYNSKKLCRTVGVGMAVIVVLTTIHLLFKNVLPMELFADIIIILILSNTICRK